MKVVLDGLPPEGRVVEGGIDELWLVEAVRQAIGVKPRGTAVKLHVNREGSERFCVTGSVSVDWKATCDRCVRLLRSSLEGPVRLMYQRGSLPTEEDLELAEGDLDIGWIQGGSLDLSDVVSEQIALWMPDRIRCGDARVSRLDPSDTGPCVLPKQQDGPPLKRNSAFSALANWKPSH